MTVITITRERRCGDCKNLQLIPYKGKLKRYECKLNYPINKGKKTDARRCDAFDWKYNKD